MSTEPNTDGLSIQLQLISLRIKNEDTIPGNSDLPSAAYSDYFSTLVQR